MIPPRNPLVLVPQYFGSLVFDRRTSRYLPFDREATELLLALHAETIDRVLGRLDDPDEREAVAGFFDCFYRRGFFGLDGRLAADVLEADVPPDHLVGPLAVHLEIVAACNLACTHCFAGTLPRNHHPLTVGEMDGLFAELARLGSFRLGLTGGEPLLRKDLFEILDAATGRGLHPCLTTNALLLTEETARELGRRELVWLNVSLEGPSAEVNDPVRGGGTFDAVLEKLRLLRRHARFTLAFTILRTNAHLVRQCAELAHEVGAHTAVFRPLYPVGTALHHLDLMPSFAQYSDALGDLAEMDCPTADLRGLDPFGPESRADTQPLIHTSHACGAGNHVCSVSVQGDVNPCSFLGPAFNSGNIRETPFEVIWRTGRQEDSSVPQGFNAARFHLNAENKLRRRYSGDGVMPADGGDLPQPPDPHGPRRYDTKPMVAVSWQAALELAERLSTSEVRYSLPTEARWKKGARGGLIGARHAWGDEPPAPDRCDFNRFREFSILPMTTFEPNGYGLYAMNGCVWEWTGDWYDRDYYRESPDTDPEGPAKGEEKVLRGGSWSDCADVVTVMFRMSRGSASWREGNWGEHLAPNIGFRLCRTLARKA